MTKTEKTVFLMQNRVQNYNWGTTDFISEFTGKANPGNDPQAELWMGAHPKAPSLIDSEIALDKYIAGSPEKILGNKIAEKFRELPFLFKILSSKKPLSIQVHPNREQAIAGFDYEEKKFLPMDSKVRNYKDRNHKPELLLALTGFHALAGVRPFQEIAEIISFLRLDRKIEEFSALIKDLTSQSLKDFFNWLLQLKSRKKDKVLHNVLRAAGLRRGCENPAADAIEWICLLDKSYPDDIGIITPLFLNTIFLHPGEAIFMNAGTMHAYLKGSGLEIMANSDNVLRCGLTQKYIDLPELMKIARFEPAIPELIRPYMNGLEEIYPAPAEEFRISRFQLQSSILIKKQTSAEIILIHEGELTITPTLGECLTLSKGQSAFISYQAGGYKLSGKAAAFRAQVNPEKDLLLRK